MCSFDRQIKARPAAGLKLKCFSVMNCCPLVELAVEGVGSLVGDGSYTTDIKDNCPDSDLQPHSVSIASG